MKYPFLLNYDLCSALLYLIFTAFESINSFVLFYFKNEFYKSDNRYNKNSKIIHSLACKNQFN